MIQFLLGAIAMASTVAGLVFLSYYRRTRDRLFLYFAASFWLDAVGRVWSTIWQVSDDSGGAVYGLRVVAYALIVVAILEKNLQSKRKS